jgi:alpha-L-fucosidase
MTAPQHSFKSSITGIFFYVFLFLATGCGDKEAPAATTTGPKEAATTYEEDWASLGRYNEDPEWFRKAKFGIYFHWGLYSVPAFQDEWYPRWMHFKGNPVYEHHKATYGEPAEF